VTSLVKLYFVFFKIGLFTVGGGLATLPLLESEIVNKGLVSKELFVNMIAISQSTPGPIGVNMATYIGFNQLDVIGSIIATLGLVTPSIIIITLIAKLMLHFTDSNIVKGIFKGIRPAVVGIIGSVIYSTAKITLLNSESHITTKYIFSYINGKACLLFIVLYFITNKWNLHPVFYLLLGALVGMFVF
jgi:chromate transporter